MIFAVFFVVTCVKASDYTEFKPKCFIQHHSPVNWTADCSYTRITRLPADMKGFPVTEIILRHNHLNSSISFHNWTHLRRVDLSCNVIGVVTNSMFSEFTELARLNLSSNDLRSISGEHFVNKLYVESLDLSHNTQLTPHEHFFDDLQKVIDRGMKRLSLRGINLKWLPENYFERSYELKVLDLSQNQLKTVSSFPTSLSQLDISDNLFTRLTFTQFRDCVNLEVLIVENNPFLTDIPEDSFYCARKLAKVSLRGNLNLSGIPEGLFVNVPLKYLSLADCGFRTLSTAFRVTFDRLQYIDLRNNPWECNNNLKWFLELETNVNDDRLRCNNTDTSFAEYYETALDHGFLQDILFVLMCVIATLFGMSIWIVYSSEFRTKVKNLYSPLDSVTNTSQPVYVSTVRSTSHS
uniref:Leucine repeat-rich protein n=1 Tax=Corythucha ciliata TaxID=369451 RepID=A0A1Z1JMX3_CORCT|nr:leucine repeat-rich protein [Corythucha ciliata]